VPYADVGPIKVESSLPDEKVLFLSDIFPTGYMAAENCDIEPGDTVAVWGCGPVKIEKGEIDPSFVITHRIKRRRRAGGLQDLPRQEQTARRTSPGRRRG
jgi:hypothetical protein